MTKDVKNHNTNTLDSDIGYTSKAYGHIHEFYLSGEILPAEAYNEWFDIIRNAGSEDYVKIYINSPGGDLCTAIQFLRVLNETNATVTTSVEGACMSAATMIFLSGHRLEVTPHSLFMFHNYSGGAFGKGGEMFEQISFQHKWSEKLFKEVYQDFLTEEEIQEMMHGRDLWLDCDEVLKRAKRAMAARNKKEETQEEGA